MTNVFTISALVIVVSLIPKSSASVVLRLLLASIALGSIWTSPLITQAIEYEMLRTPGYAAGGFWVAIGMMWCRQHFGLRRLVHALESSLIAVALTIAAIDISNHIAAYDPFTLEDAVFHPAVDLLMQLILGAGVLIAVLAVSNMRRKNGAIAGAAAGTTLSVAAPVSAAAIGMSGGVFSEFIIPLGLALISSGIAWAISKFSARKILVLAAAAATLLCWIPLSRAIWGSIVHA